MERVEVTSTFASVIHMQVCAVEDATDDEILEVCNRKNPSGTTNGWGAVIRETDNDKIGFEDNKAPVRCDKHADRMHFMVVC